MIFQKKCTNFRDFYLVKKGPKNLGIGKPPPPTFGQCPKVGNFFQRIPSPIVGLLIESKTINRGGWSRFGMGKLGIILLISEFISPGGVSQKMPPWLLDSFHCSGELVNCGAHQAQSCADCPQVIDRTYN